MDPEWTQTRLGDGFYEQRLVLDQIIQLTGRRYLGNYADGVAQYRALLESGAAAAGQLQLSMGVGLTAAQAAALTQDIVWMVEQDYQGQKVLVPVVYLASNSLQLRGNGALIAGGNVELNATNSMSNQGVIAGADVSITAAICSTRAASAALALYRWKPVTTCSTRAGSRVATLHWWPATIWSAKHPRPSTVSAFCPASAPVTPCNYSPATT
ncbi:hypothetical protein NYR97_18410 [Xanthomonas hydrangeae]|uniref:Uncharacterized protein n=1 Tax=Xanthomonas hydrangeae TaxID=2775159 RepID=A0AAU0B836_9XANT|nr:hypothetical protein NYR97_18410 [Xanthomonas hydrangeae]